jgi:hypothetical protein
VSVERYIGEDGKIRAPNMALAGPVPVVDPLPDIASMIALPDDELIRVLQRYGVTVTWEELRANMLDTVRAAMRIPAGAPDYRERMEYFLDSGSRRTLVGMARRASEQYATKEALDGDAGALLIRISEGDDHVCGPCEARAGIIGTLAEHEAMGAPGAASCDGGDYCRCQLVRID